MTNDKLYIKKLKQELYRLKLFKKKSEKSI